MIGRRIAFVVGLFSLLLGSAVMPESASAQSKLDAIENSKTLRVGWAIYYPYIFRDPKTNEVTGYSIDIVNDMAKALGPNVKVELVEDAWGTFAAGLQANKFDIFPGAAITLQRALAVGFSEPYTVQPYGLIAPKDAAASAKSWHDLDKPDEKIAVTLGASTDVYLHLAMKQAEIIRVKEVPEGVLSLLTGKVNAYASALDSLETIQKAHTELGIVPGFFAKGGFAFAVPRGDIEWLNWVNLFVRDEKATGRITALLDKYGMNHSFAAE
jgi:polar amino acid transport system substrate-binding protein